jgi:hypothetical protein
MNSERRYIFKTNYFNRPLMLIKRMFIITFLILVLIYSVQAYPGAVLWKSLLAIICILYVVVKPQDDLAIDEKHFYHFKRSILPSFNRTREIDIDRIKSIGEVKGIHSWQFEMMKLLEIGFPVSVKIIFKDNSSTILTVPLKKKRVHVFLLKLKEVMSKRN